MTAYRLRFTLAHELGHLIYGHELFTPNAESELEANLFAGALLLPIDGIEEDFEQALTLKSLQQLKGKWGVSMSALIMRARRLDVISDYQMRSLFETLRQKGWRTCEPGDLETKVETPMLIEEICQRIGIKVDAYNLAELFGLAVQDVKCILGNAGTDFDLSHLSVN